MLKSGRESILELLKPHVLSSDIKELEKMLMEAQDRQKKMGETPGA